MSVNASTPPAPLEFVLFDLDGVLVDSRVPIARSMNFALEQEGLALEPEERLHRWIGPPLHAGFHALLEARGADLGRVDACIAHYREHYRLLSLEETGPMPGMAAVLEALAPLPLGVATSKPEAFARPILERLGWDGAFRQVVGPPLEGSHLEHKSQTVARARVAMGMEAARGAMVGDRAVDVEAGRNNGLLTIGVTWGIGTPEELRRAAPDWLVDNPLALTHQLKKGDERPLSVPLSFADGTRAGGDYRAGAALSGARG